MKLRQLKKKNFILHFDYFLTYNQQYYDVEIQFFEQKLQGFVESEYDNGLYVETSTIPIKITWKDIKYNLQNYTLRSQKQNRKPYWIKIYTGKCPKCGKKIDLSTFKHNYYCEDCFQKRLQLFLGEE